MHTRTFHLPCDVFKSLETCFIPLKVQFELGFRNWGCFQTVLSNLHSCPEVTEETFFPLSPFPREWRPTISSARFLQLLSIVSHAFPLRAKQPGKEDSSHFSSVNPLLEFSSMLIALDFSPTFLSTWPHDYFLTGSSTGASSRAGVPSTTEITWDQNL